ncbi:hypothetical protein MMC12_006941 [Toensbergia leucococca]|nr:hypothetical protein [Toensbergia leucococca]
MAERRDKWNQVQELAGQEGWFPTEESKIDLEEAKKAHEEFRQWLKDSLLSRSGRDLEAAQKILEGLNRSTYETLDASMTSYLTKNALETAGEARNFLAAKRSTGVKTLSAGFQCAVRSFRDLLWSYSGIVDIASTADPMYVGVAYQSLSVLFSVLASKGDLEDRIKDIIDDLKNHLPDLMIYERIYRNAQLGRKIAAVYRGILHFCIFATKYCMAKHGYIRWLRVLSRKDDFQSVQRNLQRDILPIKSQCEVLLSDTVDKLKQELHDSAQKLDNLQAGTNDKRLVQIGNLLGVKHPQGVDTVKSMKEYRSLLQKYIVDDDKRERLALEVLQNTAEYRQWMNSQDSEMLILCGRNEESTWEIEDLSWLSPAAIDFAEHVQKQGTIVLHFLCQEKPLSSKTPSGQEVISNMIYQLLNKEPGILADIKEFNALQSQMKRRDMKKWDLSMTGDIMIKALEYLRGKGTIYLVIDRMDQFNEEESTRVDSLREVVRIARNSACTLKILTVVNTLFWPLEKAWRRLEARRDGTLEYIRLLRRDQQRLE